MALKHLVLALRKFGLNNRWSLNKKGVFFSFIAVIFLSLLMFSLGVGDNYKMRQKSFVIETRIDTMNRFIIAVEEDIKRGAFIAGYRSFFELNNYVVSEGEYITDLNSSFSELFINGTLNGNVSSKLVNNTITHWMQRIQDEAVKVDIIINFSIHNITLFHEEPWTVTVNTNLAINLSDKTNVSSWNKELSINSKIDLEGLEDPVYWKETNGAAQNIIFKTNYSYFVSGNDTSNLLGHCNDGYYIAFNGAPDYLMKMQGNFGASEFGIESLVEVDELPVAFQFSKSIVDYIYFGNATPEKHQVDGLPSWFDLDNETNMDLNQTHIELYGVEGLI